jgi:hypothetical protein
MILCRHTLLIGNSSIQAYQLVDGIQKRARGPVGRIRAHTSGTENVDVGRDAPVHDVADGLQCCENVEHSVTQGSISEQGNIWLSHFCRN